MKGMMIIIVITGFMMVGVLAALLLISERLLDILIVLKNRK